MDYEGLMIVSFGGPERPEEVMPFLERVTRGRPVPRERLEDVARHYHHCGGKSPINAQTRELKEALEKAFVANKITLPVLIGYRNAKPFFADTLQEMKARGMERVLGFFMSSMSSYSGCRQYQENIAAARALVGEGAPEVEKIRAYFNHPLFIETAVERIRECLGEHHLREAETHLVFTTHSLPLSMARSCDYEVQYRESCRLVAESLGLSEAQYTLAFQSRSGPPHIPWLGPDVREVIASFSLAGVQNIVLVPIGFISDHMEVIYDLDCDVRDAVRKRGFQYARAKTPGTHPLFIRMICELVSERLDPDRPRRFLGALGPRADQCPPDCCLVKT